LDVLARPLVECDQQSAQGPIGDELIVRLLTNCWTRSRRDSPSMRQTREEIEPDIVRTREVVSERVRMQ
jgi:hypothetical protein